MIDRKIALLRYIAILFFVAFLLVLFSLLAQMRNNKQTISELNQSSASSMSKVEQLQEQNRSLQEENASLKEQIEQLTAKLMSDEKMKEFFAKDPIKTVEQVLGVDLPDEIIEKIVAGVKAKLTADQIAGAASFLKKLF